MDGGASVNSSYEITAPVFDKIRIELNPEYYPGDKFLIITENNAPDNPYIQKAQLNGTDWTNVSFSHDAFSKGGSSGSLWGKIPTGIGADR